MESKLQSLFLNDLDIAYTGCVVKSSKIVHALPHLPPCLHLHRIEEEEEHI